MCLQINSPSNKGKKVPPRLKFFKDDLISDSEVPNITQISFFTKIKLTVDGSIQNNYYVQCLLHAKDLGHLSKLKCKAKIQIRIGNKTYSKNKILTVKYW